ncbi:MAG: hypothetical protein VX642_08370 [Bdellovibrionota bacterium]|nr:hypothetical protein [Bdellovibrionota bacterium]
MEQTGGIFYHYLAVRNSLRYWRNYQISIESFLTEALNCDKKILVGPSGGYSLSKSHFLQIQSEDIIAELDPLARLILKSKLGTKVNWVNQDLFKINEDPILSAKLSAEEFNSLNINRVIFCNMLGQLAYQYSGFTDLYWKLFLLNFLKNLNAEVYSYHDRWSILSTKAFLDSFETEFIKLSFLQKQIIDIKSLCEKVSNNSSSSTPVEILDHATDMDNSLRYKFHAVHPWRRTKNCLHLIHCISLPNL